jgi:hypothetical protein
MKDGMPGTANCELTPVNSNLRQFYFFGAQINVIFCCSCPGMLRGLASAMQTGLRAWIAATMHTIKPQILKE